MRRKDYIDFMNTVAPSDELENRLLSAAQNGVKPDISEDEVQVSGVERYRRPVWLGRLGALAAAVAVIVAVGGAYGAVGHLSRQVDPADEVLTAEVTEPVTEPQIKPLDEEIPPPTLVNGYDMNTPEGIAAAVLNSVSFYDRASGVCVRLPFASANCGDIVYFSYDTVTGEYRMTDTSLTLTNTYADLAEGALPEGYEGNKYGSHDYYSDGEVCYEIDPEGYMDMYRRNEYFEEINGRRDTSEVDVEGALEAYRYDGSITAMKGCPLENNAAGRALRCLAEGSQFQVTSEVYCGRDSVLLTGQIAGGSFAMTVDRETGVLLKYVEYGESGEVCDLFVMHEIAFGSEAEPIETYSTEGMREFRYEDMASYDYPVNAKGETYGHADGQINERTRPFLPDLIEMDGGYIYVDDIISQGGDYRVVFGDTHQFPIGDESPIYQINLYTKNGDYIRTINLYQGYVDE